MLSSFLIIAAIVVGVAMVWRHISPERTAALAREIESRWLPPALGLITTFLVTFVWGSLDQVAVIHDERAYLLQSQIFAHGRWTAPSPPLPAFFEQMHVLVVPHVAAKYPPGHALLMTPGTLLGLPGLMPVLLSGLAGMLLFLLARRVANTPVALLTWFLWSTGPNNLYWRATYFSEVTSSAAVLLAWWALLEWRRTGGLRMLVLLAFAVGWGAITRPFTVVAFAAPIVVVVLVDTVRRRAWRNFAIATAVGLAVLSLVPLWSMRTTGNWRLTPLTLYTRMYIPFDKPGFGFDATLPERPLPSDLHDAMTPFARQHAAYTPAALPSTALARARAITWDMWSGWRYGFVLFAALGLTIISAELMFALGSSLLVFAAYLLYAHAVTWTIYYLELMPVLAFLTALGVWRVVTAIMAVPLGEPSVPSTTTTTTTRSTLAAATLIAIAMLPTVVELPQLRSFKAHRTLEQRLFRAQLASLPASKALVFVRYAQNHNGNYSLVGNVADLERARVWIAYDRGRAQDEALMRLAPNRVPYLYEQLHHALVPMNRLSSR